MLKKRDTPAGKRYNVVESTRSYVQYLRETPAPEEQLSGLDRYYEEW